MPLDAHIAAFFAEAAASGARPFHLLTPPEARRAFRRMTSAVRAHRAPAAVGRVEETTVPGAEGPLRARVYRPEAAGPAPTVAFFHGGGFVIGDLDTHDDTARALCRATGSVVVSVDYRLAPEHPFPAAVEDAVTVVPHLAGRLDRFGGDRRLAVAGDSAGGTLAAVAAQHMRDHGEHPIAAQLLLYPGVDAVGGHPSLTENRDAPLLDSRLIAWFRGHHAPGRTLADDPRLSPLRAADLSGLPPAVVVTAEFDPLRDEGEAYAEALGAAGVPVELRRCAGMTHGFLGMDFAPRARAYADEAYALFAALLAPAAADRTSPPPPAGPPAVGAPVPG